MAKNVIITGAAGGLGKSVVQKFIEDGYHVFALTQPGRPEQEEELREISADKNALYIEEVNVLNSYDIADCVQNIVEKHKSIDAAVMIVGGYAGGGFLDMLEGQLDHMISLNVKSALFMAQSCFPAMEEVGGGTLVFIGARPALEVKMGIQATPYALSKRMLIYLAELIHQEGKSKNIRTAVIVPHIIDTPTNRQHMPDADFSTWSKPSEIAEVIAFACSEKSEKLDDQMYKIYAHAE